MKKLLGWFKKLFGSSQGFTLIELLIVITILGILATAVLAAINPLEQINRGRDTGSKSDAEQLLSAVARFNAAKGYYPWQTSPQSNRAVAWTQVRGNTPPDDQGMPILEKLGPDQTAELLPAYLQRITASDYNPLFVYRGSGSGDSTYVCFSPQSGQMKKEAEERCDNSPTDYPDQACLVGEDPFVCLP